MHLDKLLEDPRNYNNSLKNIQSFLCIHTATVELFKSLKSDPIDYLHLDISMCSVDIGKRNAFEKQCSSQTIYNLKNLITFVK